MIGVVVPDALAYSILPIMVTGVLSLVTYLFRQIARAAEAQARSDVAMAGIVVKLEELSRRVSVVERRWERWGEPSP